jgi:cysteinyl-tRNA synthetase
VEEFTPLNDGHVKMYVCGMTVYDYCHLGHARSMIAFDVVQRWLKVSGYKVTYVRNITDIDDKIIRRAVENNESIRALTNRMIDALHEDSDALGIEPPSLEPRATDYIPQMLSMIDTLKQNGLAYQTQSGDVNFAVRKFKGYGKLSGKSLDELHAGERVAVLDEKDDPLDFVLWKSAKPEEPDEVKWSSHFGAGRPGWHIECSAMSLAALGMPIDIHGGGADLQFPHHENEIAQSEGASSHYFAEANQPHPAFANFWMHNGFINVDNEKMSKSLGNFFTIRDVLKLYDPETIRFFVVRSHYRSPLNYSNVHLDDAKGALKRLYTALSLVSSGDNVQTLQTISIDWNNPYAARFRSAMDEDFATPEAVSILFELAGEVNRTRSGELAALLKSLGATLGLLQRNPNDFLQNDVGAKSGDLSAEQIEALIEARSLAKKNKDFAAADKIRTDLAAKNVILKDSPQGTQWERG